MKYQQNLSELICKAQALVKSLLHEKDASLTHAAPGLRQEQCGELSNYLNSAILLVRTKKSKPKPDAPATGLTFDQLRKANRERLPLFKNCHGEQAHTKADGSDWTPSQWLQAVIGELGEYANFRKKFERGDISFEDFKRYAAKELADVQTYLDILAMRCLDSQTLPHPTGIDLGKATVDKFNEVSKRVGCTVFLGYPKADSVRVENAPIIGFGGCGRAVGEGGLQHSVHMDNGGSPHPDEMRFPPTKPWSPGGTPPPMPQPGLAAPAPQVGDAGPLYQLPTWMYLQPAPQTAKKRTIDFPNASVVRAACNQYRSHLSRNSDQAMGMVVDIAERAFLAGIDFYKKEIMALNKDYL